MKKNIEQIAREDGRFCPDAVKFVYEGLAYTVKAFKQQPGHITGQTLALGLAEFAIEKWGRLALMVLNNWNIKKTRDFGEIVYLMIKHEWMSSQPTDTIEDFANVYNFDTVFKKNIKF